MKFHNSRIIGAREKQMKLFRKQVKENIIPWIERTKILSIYAMCKLKEYD